MTAPCDQSEINIIYIDSLSDFTRELKIFEKTNKDEDSNKKYPPSPAPLWFRGNPNFNFELLPRLYRTVKQHLEKQDIDPLDFWEQVKEDEKYYLTNFKIRNYFLLKRQPENPLTWMTIMQHYELPTRLLDWSEIATAALFFALSDEFSRKREFEGLAPCVWCLKPLELNRSTYLHYHLIYDTKFLPDMFSLVATETMNYSDKMDKHTISNYYFPEKSPTFFTNTFCYPLAINAPYNNERIRAQSGAFTLFPLNTPITFEKFEDLGMENLPDAGRFLRLFILRKPVEISYELKAMGVKRSQFFPEMPSISYDIEQELYKSS